METHLAINVSRQGTMSSHEKGTLEDKYGSWSDLTYCRLLSTWQNQRNKSLSSKSCLYKSSSFTKSKEIQINQKWGLYGPTLQRKAKKSNPFAIYKVSFILLRPDCEWKLRVWIEKKVISLFSSNLYSFPFICLPFFYYFQCNIYNVHIVQWPKANIPYTYYMFIHFQSIISLFSLSQCVSDSLGCW